MDFKAIRAQIKAEKTVMQEKNKAILNGAFKEFFTQFPLIKSVVWCQYTPYFNDGDACEFSVGDIYFSKKEWNVADVGSPYDLDDDADTVSIYGEDAKNQLREFASLLNSLEDALLQTFGDHTMVVATAKGFETEEYSHD